MKYIFWNARGLANSPSRLALKRLILLHMPDFIFISEPWMDFNDFPRNWFTRLHFKLFAVNNRNNLLPNLWCFCNINLNPVVLGVDNQQVSFSLVENGKSFACSAVYASTNYISRRALWNSLSNLQSQFALPWSFIGDFNCILGAHEHRGRTNPARLPIQEFQAWTDVNNLIHLPTRGVEFTWSNGRGGGRHTDRRLDRVICNQEWLDMCCSMSVDALTKHKSDHFPILMEFKLSDVSFASQFKFMRMWAMHQDCKQIIQEIWNTNVIGCPMFVLNSKLKSLKVRLKVWNKESFGNVHDLVNKAEQTLQEVQNKIQLLGNTDSLLLEEKEAHRLFEEALNKQECFWQEKARLNWHLEGDRNTKFFHRIAKIKTTSKTITTLQDREQVITDQTHISNHIVEYYKNLFCTNVVLQEQLLAQEVIPKLITNEINNLLTMLPSHQEIKSAVFSLNKDSAPGPDGFGAFFYQTYWDIIKEDVVKAVLEFFTTSWILPGYNSNIIALLPKTPEATSIDQYRPIAMANFKFKIISKVIADRLAPIMPNIISEEQMGFIHQRNIRDCLCIASEATNLLHNKAFGGNLVLKIDITKAFDTLEWSFLMQTLKCFGFNDTFCNWIHSILHSAYLSISVNGKAQGYFNCSRGVRQGDPLSPLLFCLAEDVLSRSISKLVEEGKLDLIKGSRHCSVPSHTFYADDLMIYCKGKMSGLIVLNDLFHRYTLNSGQVINTSKSTIFSASISQVRLNRIVDLLHFKIGSIPFNYLGVPIFKGKPKASYLQPVADKIKMKLSAWKASLLSMAGRVQLARSVIQSMMMYSISLYSWPVSLLKEVERYVRNFIWSGDKDKRKLVTVSWKKMCRPAAQGGLNLRSLQSLNAATNLNLCWDFLNSQKAWAKLLKDRVIRNKNTIQHHIYSSVWSSIKEEFNVIMENSQWLIGKGDNINFWNDSWAGQPLVQLFNIPDHISSHLTSSVSDYIHEGRWHFPPQLIQSFPALMQLAQQVTIPVEEQPDCLQWKHDQSGHLCLKEAYKFKHHQFQELHWAKTIWSVDVPPSKSMFIWRLMHNKVPTDENLKQRGCSFPSICNLCHKQEESSFHLFFNCEYSIRIWSWLASCLNLSLNFSCLEDVWKICDSSWSPQCKVIVLSALVNLFNVIWYARNQARFNTKNIHWKSAISMIISSTTLAGNTTKKTSSNSIRDFTLIKLFNVSVHHPRAPIIKEVMWHPPPQSWVKCNIDGAAKGNPGLSAAGGVFRDYEGQFILCFSEPLGISTSYISEMNGAIRAVETAFHKGWRNLWLETDSSLVVLAFQRDGQIPWSLTNRWKNMKLILRQMNCMVTHIYREGNEVADTLANHGISLQATTFWEEMPSFIRDNIIKNQLGMPSFRFITF